MVTIKLIEQLICEKENICSKDLHKKTRKDPVCTIRQLVMMFAVKYGYTDIEAGEYFKLDRCTTINAKRSIRNRYDTDRKFREKFDRYDYLIKNIPDQLNTYANILERLREETSELKEMLSMLSA